MRDGVYINLPFEEYLGGTKDRLGSGDKRDLWLKGLGWWWRSPNNPFYSRPKGGEDLTVGQAYHAALAEGMHAYESRFCVAPDKRQFGERLLVTVDDIKAALREAGARVGSTSGWKADDWADAVEIHLPDKVVWSSVVSEAQRRAGDRQMISAEADFGIRAMRDIATEDRPGNEMMRELLSVGTDYPIFAELTILYTDDDGLQHRARLDKLVPTATADLKSLALWQGRTLAEVVDKIIKDAGYDVQLADYQVARQHMNRMLLEGEHNLHGGTEEERTYLLALAEWNQTHQWRWAWIFLQKPASNGTAPVVMPFVEPWRGSYHRGGFRKRHVALQTYRDAMVHFGPDRPWGTVEPVHYTDEGAEHHIPVSPHDWGPDDPVPGEEEHMG